MPQASRGSHGLARCTLLSLGDKVLVSLFDVPLGAHAHLLPLHCAGGGAFKHAEIFKERLGVVLEKEDEIACLVGGLNFLLQTIPHEAFTYTAESGTTFAPTNGTPRGVLLTLLVLGRLWLIWHMYSRQGCTPIQANT